MPNLTLTSANELLGMYQADPAYGADVNLDGVTRNIMNSTVDGAGGVDTIWSDGNYGQYFTLTGTEAGVITMTTASGAKTSFKNFEKFIWGGDNTSPVQTIKLGTAAADTITGGSKDDKFLAGLANADTISGLAGNDWLFGGTGKDKLNGGTGNDIITGGADKDSMTGAGGKDVFDFNSIAHIGKNTTRDVITDFEHSVDKIDLSTINPANTSHKFGSISKGTVFHHVAGELHYTTGSGHTIISGDAGGDGKVDFQIDLVGIKTLTNVDFVL